jgi:hypothetical protein
MPLNNRARLSMSHSWPNRASKTLHWIFSDKVQADAPEPHPETFSMAIDFDIPCGGDEKRQVARIPGASIAQS